MRNGNVTLIWEKYGVIKLPVFQLSGISSSTKERQFVCVCVCAWLLVGVWSRAGCAGHWDGAEGDDSSTQVVQDEQLVCRHSAVCCVQVEHLAAVAACRHQVCLSCVLCFLFAWRCFVCRCNVIPCVVTCTLYSISRLLMKLAYFLTILVLFWILFFWAHQYLW